MVSSFFDWIWLTKEAEDMVRDESYDSNAKYFQTLIKYIPIPSTKHDIKIQIHWFSLNKQQNQILFIESYLIWFTWCIQRWVLIRKKVAIEFIMYKNAFNHT